MRIQRQQEQIWDGTNKQGSLKGHNGILSNWMKVAGLEGKNTIDKGSFYGAVKVTTEEKCASGYNIYVDGAVKNNLVEMAGLFTEDDPFFQRAG